VAERDDSAGLALAPEEAAAPRDGTLVEVLAEISRSIARTLELLDVFPHVADSVRRVVGFEAMLISEVEDADTFSLYAMSLGDRTCDAGRKIPRSQYSPGFQALLARSGRSDDLRLHLDPAYARDRETLDSGARSMLRVGLRRGDEVIGYLSLVSTRPAAFSEANETDVRPIADLLAMALEHERLSRSERERRRRHRELDALVPALAKALDLRVVFDQISALTQSVLPHDFLAIGLLEPDGRSVRIHAYTGARIPDLPETIQLENEDLAKKEWEFEIIGDIEREVDRACPKYALLSRTGIRSSLRVPIRFEGTVAGGLVFHSRTPHHFREEDVEIARRVADELTLVLSHQRMAGEARRAEEARAEAQRLEAQLARLTEELESRDGFGRIIGSARSWREVLVQATKVAQTETTVLLTGESGTGKEILSRAIHRASPRHTGPFIALNCAALPEQLLESELFGYEKGAFTGAVSAKPGRLEQAAGGVLFLDEAGEMSPLVQAKLLRVLQEKEFQRLGGTRPSKADVRIVAATNRDLSAAIARGEFREDLYYRLSVFEIRLPPLRERRDDILPLTERFLEEIGLQIGRPAGGVSREARELLLAYPWPGNVRELRNALERAAILCDGGLITASHLPISVSGQGAGPASPSSLALPVDLEALEKRYVADALKQAGSNKSRAARLLGLTRSQLYTRLEKHGLS